MLSLTRHRITFHPRPKAQWAVPLLCAAFLLAGCEVGRFDGKLKTSAPVGSSSPATGTVLSVGTGPGSLVQLDSQGRLPAVDGSLLTHLPLGILDSPAPAVGSTVSICANGSFTVVTGTGAINTFTALPAGSLCTVQFQSAGVTLLDKTISGTGNLILDGGGSFTTGDGDIFRFLSNGTDWTELPSRVTSTPSYVHYTQAQGVSASIVPGVITLPTLTKRHDNQGEIRFNADGTATFSPRQAGLYSTSLSAILASSTESTGGPNCLHAFILGVQHTFVCTPPGYPSQISASGTVYLTPASSVSFSLQLSNFQNAQSISGATILISRVK